MTRKLFLHACPMEDVLFTVGSRRKKVHLPLQAGLVAPLRRAMERGAVLCGGSAGAICWSVFRSRAGVLLRRAVSLPSPPPRHNRGWSVSERTGLP